MQFTYCLVVNKSVTQIQEFFRNTMTNQFHVFTSVKHKLHFFTYN